MSARIDHAHFIALLTERFPAVAASVDDCSLGLLHPEMATLARATQAAIDRGDKDTVVAHFAFVHSVFGEAAPDVENAIYVSYLENLQFDGRKSAVANARQLLTPRLSQALQELEAHLAQIHGKNDQ